MSDGCSWFLVGIYLEDLLSALIIWTFNAFSLLSVSSIGLLCIFHGSLCSLRSLNNFLSSLSNVKAFVI